MCEVFVPYDVFFSEGEVAATPTAELGRRLCVCARRTPLKVFRGGRNWSSPGLAPATKSERERRLLTLN